MLPGAGVSAIELATVIRGSSAGPSNSDLACAEKMDSATHVMANADRLTNERMLNTPLNGIAAILRNRAMSGKMVCAQLPISIIGHAREFDTINLKTD